MKNVNQPFRKKDAMQLVTGKPVYMDDLAPADCLIVKLLRSPHPNAIVKTINTTVAKKVPGIEAIFTWEDVDQNGRRYTQAGQTYPEASPYDRLVIDRHVRFVGDVVAIVAGVDDRCVDKAMKLIKVEYEVLEPVLDFHTAKDNPILVHPEDNWESLCPVGADNKRNLCAHDECGSGDIEEWLSQPAKIVTLHPMTIMQNSLNGTFGQSGDISNVPPRAATIGPIDVMRAKERIEVHALATNNTFSSWQRMTSRLVTHGPVTPYVPSSMLQTKKTQVYISEELAAPFECWEKVGY